jgi:hypothetical protein
MRQGGEIGVVADVIERLIAERVADLIAVHGERERDIARRMYRRGYLAGRAAQRRGAMVITNPERHARGELREILAMTTEARRERDSR